MKSSLTGLGEGWADGERGGRILVLLSSPTNVYFVNRSFQDSLTLALLYVDASVFHKPATKRALFYLRRKCCLAVVEIPSVRGDGK